ncbi:MAG TPA: hypothetical protein VK886_19790 [Vicinamibacterales bacterium]|nr:hypothetical protein [Vicinamibacterales bacterium]
MLAKRNFLGFVIGILTPSLAIAAGQAGQPKTVTASVSVTTSDTRRNLAVLSKGTGGEPAFLFCIDLEAPQKIEFTGRARVVYRPLPLGDIPAGVKISGPEGVSSALAVLPTSGKGWLFLAKNEKAILAAGEPAAAGATVVPVRVVRRVDWVGDRGERRGMDIESCFEVGG